ncbi:hypothetical protein LCGC14_2909180 [marine sediment metagenome]|uniref:Uncharacterized protein n=1 Tax=marine sediment metagenome TaxID=412755 RepID=A0A0F8XS70_9ZZZZ
MGGIKAPSAMRRFCLQRADDETGVSGEGRVAEGVEFSDGTCALRWLTHTACTGNYANTKQLVLIHGHGGKTRLVWVDPIPAEEQHGTETETEAEEG